MKVKKYGHEFIVTDNPSYLEFWTNAFSKNWESDTFQFLDRHLDPKKTVLDIGAWIGPIAIPSALSSKQVICFEPDPIAYDELQKNINLNNLKNIHIEKKAVSIHDKIWLGSNTLGESVTRDTCDTNKFSIDCINIDAILKKYELTQSNISLIKIDIEGHESELLQDVTLMTLDVPMHISLHYPFAINPEEFSKKIRPFFEAKNINIETFEHSFITVEIN
jgi:FkbM family methyltransferase